MRAQHSFMTSRTRSLVAARKPELCEQRTGTEASEGRRSLVWRSNRCKGVVEISPVHVSELLGAETELRQHLGVSQHLLKQPQRNVNFRHPEDQTTKIRSHLAAQSRQLLLDGLLALLEILGKGQRQVQLGEHLHQQNA